MSSAGNYIVGSIVSYFLNKYFTFKNHQKSAKTVLKFVVNIAGCYLVAYGLAKPVAAWIFSGFSVKTQEKYSHAGGNVYFRGNELFRPAVCGIQRREKVNKDRLMKPAVKDFLIKS